jgi:hypothetical protein
VTGGRITQAQRIDGLLYQITVLRGEVAALRAGTELLAKAMATFLGPVSVRSADISSEPAPERPRLRVIGGRNLSPSDERLSRPRGRLHLVGGDQR